MGIVDYFSIFLYGGFQIKITGKNNPNMLYIIPKNSMENVLVFPGSLNQGFF